MKNIAQFTTAAGRAIGVPTLGGLIVLDLTVKPLPEQPKGSKSLLRYMIGGEDGFRIAWLKDPYKHVLSKLPVSAAGPWAHMKASDGNSVAFPRGTICYYEQTDDEVWDISLAIPTGPVGLKLKGTFKELEDNAGLIADSPDDQETGVVGDQAEGG